jgi:hypothetical protein
VGGPPVGGPPVGSPPAGGPPDTGVGKEKLLLMTVFIQDAIEHEVPAAALVPAAGGVTGDGGRCAAEAGVIPVNVVVRVAMAAINSNWTWETNSSMFGVSGPIGACGFEV